MTIVLKFFLFVQIILVIINSQAGETSATTSSSSSTSTNTNQSPAQFRAPTPTADPSAYQNAVNIAAGNKQASGMASQAAGMFQSIGQGFMSCCSKNPGCCAAAIAMFIKAGKSNSQAGVNFGTGLSADYTAGGTYAYDDYGGGATSASRNADAAGREANSQAAKFAAMLKDMEAGKYPVKFDSKSNTFSDPNGKKYKSSDFDSDSSMAAAGIPKASIDDINGKTKQVEKSVMEKMKTMAALAPRGEYEDQSMMGSYSGNSQSAGNEVLAPGPQGVDRAAIQREVASSVLGMSKNYNGNPIGVSVDSIFSMMTRRYQLKDKQNTFFDDSEILLRRGK